MYNVSVEKLTAVVHGRKGGIGKTRLAYELAYVWAGILLDLEWDEGSASYKWGFRASARVRDPLWSALESGKAPRPMTGFRKPDLVPQSLHTLDAGLGADEMADLVTRWAGEWDKDVVVDTHPGAHEVTHGAIAAANVICVPVPLRTDDLNATEQIVAELADYPLVLVPSMVRRVPPRAELDRLERMIRGTPVQVAPPIPFVGAIETRKRRMAITAEDPPPKALRIVAGAYREVAQFVREVAAA